MMDDLAFGARFPAVPRKAAHYESFYCTAHHPSEALAFWIRYTTFKRPGETTTTGSLWFTLFRPGGPAAVKQTFPGPGVQGDAIAIGDARLWQQGLAGRAGASGRDASWDLSIASDEKPHRYLPSDLMYRGPIPRTKPLSLSPSAAFSGTVTIDGEKISVDGWNGMLGHNWGTEHSERWIWLHGVGFESRGPDTWIDAVIGRVRIGPVTTPWIANGTLSLDGTRHRFGGIERARATKIEEAVDGCRTTLPGKGFAVHATVDAPRARAVGWRYADPDGSEHHVLNNSIADLGVRVVRPGEPETTLFLPGGAAYELGMREADHGVPLQPFD